MAKKIRIDIDMAVNGKEVIQSTVSDVEELKKRTREIPEDLKKLNESLRGTSRFGDIFAKITESGKPMQRQLREIQKLLSEMKFEGLDNTEEFQAMTQYAGNMADAIADARANVNYFASDTRKLDTAVGMFQGVAGALSVAQGALALFDDDNKAFEQTMKKVQGTLALVNGVQAISNTLNRDSALVMGVKNLQTKLATMWSKAHGGAVLAEAAATKGATVATRALNTVLKANPVGLVITAITTLIGLFTLLSGKTEENTEKMKEQEAEAKRLAEQQAHAHEVIGNAVADSTGKFMKLSVEWRNLKTENERQNWINNNASAFKSLGLNVKSVTDANEVFIRQMPRILEVLRLQAEASANLDLYIEAYKERQKRLADPNLGNGGARFDPVTTWRNAWALRDSKGNAISYAQRNSTINDIIGDYGLQKGVHYEDEGMGRVGALTAEGERYLTETARARAKEIRDRINEGEQKRMDTHLGNFKKFTEKATKMVEDIPNMYNPSTSADPYAKSSTSTPKTSTSTPKVKTTQTKATTPGIRNGAENQKAIEQNLTELEKLRAERDKLLKALTNPRLTEYERAELTKRKEDLDDQISFREQWKAGMMDVGDLPVSEFVLPITIKPDPDASGKNLDDFAKAHPLNLETKFSAGEWEGLSNAMDVRAVAQENMDKIRGWFDAGLIGREKAEELAAAVNANLEHNGIKPIKLEIDDTEMKSAGETLRDTWGGVQGLVGGFNNLSQALEGNKSAWEVISGTINSVLQIMDGFRQASQLISLFTASTQTATTATTAATAATTAHTAVTTADTAASTLQSTANATEAVTKATAEGTKAGWPGLLFAIPAALAVVMAGLAMAGAFANGGIVGGTSMSGDKLLARVNSGEMILNKSQQTRLFGLLNGLTPPSFRTPSIPNLDGLRANSGGTMDFRISGRNLVGVLANETRISRKSGRRTMIKI